MKFGLPFLAAFALLLNASAAPAPGATRDPQRFSFAVSGDLLGPDQPLLSLGDPDLLEVAKILKSADGAFANLESSAFDLNTFTGTKAALHGGGYPRFDTAIVRDFRDMGLSMVSLANNHASDWGEDGLTATLATLDRLGIVHAGGGASLSQAREPAILQTPRGRVALVAAASTFVASSPASDGAGALRPRPGISVLRTKSAVVVSDAQMKVLEEIGRRPSGAGADGSSAWLQVGSQAFATGPRSGRTYLVNDADEEAILKSIAAARKNAEYVVFSLHAHETAGGSDDATPGDFLPPFFRKVIDAGADIIIRHGPHVMNGIEIYKGKPIFYSLGSLFFGVGGPARQYTTPEGQTMRFPQSWYDTAVAVTEFEGGRAARIKIHPLTIETDDLRMFSSPKPASPADAARILAELQKNSSAYGTVLRIEKGIGVIDLPPGDRTGARAATDLQGASR